MSNVTSATLMRRPRIRGASARRSDTAERPTGRFREGVVAVLFALLGIAGVIGTWAVVAAFAPDLPSPAVAFDALGTLMGDAFSANSPNGKGVMLELFTSLWRTVRGFALAGIVGVPLGLFIGANRRAWQAFNPIIQILRPVSPLAWFPIGLVVLKDGPAASVFVIYITALWPTVLNTAAGAASVPLDQRNVARVFRFSRWEYVRHIMIPHSVPSIMTGLRLSMGIGWMVIVAVEMLSGSAGIGSFVWNSYNGGNLSWVISAIILIGLVGVTLDAVFMRVGRRWTAEVTP